MNFNFPFVKCIPKTKNRPLSKTEEQLILHFRKLKKTYRKLPLIVSKEVYT